MLRFIAVDKAPRTSTNCVSRELVPSSFPPCGGFVGALHLTQLLILMRVALLFVVCWEVRLRSLLGVIAS
jgi:hypothetical protein